MLTIVKCRQVQERLSDYLDGGLERQEGASLERHVANCPDCRRCLETLRRTIELCRELPALDFPAGLHEQIMDRIRRHPVQAPFTMHLVVVKVRRPAVAGHAASAFGDHPDQLSPDTGEMPPETPLWVPRINILDEEDHFRLMALIPGCRRESLRVMAGRDSVRISGRNEMSRREQALFFLREIKTGFFFREIHLPEWIVPEKTHASYRDSMLRLLLFKKNAAPVALGLAPES